MTAETLGLNEDSEAVADGGADDKNKLAAAKQPVWKKPQKKKSGKKSGGGGGGGGGAGKSKSKPKTTKPGAKPGAAPGDEAQNVSSSFRPVIEVFSFPLSYFRSVPIRFSDS